MMHPPPYKPISEPEPLLTSQLVNQPLNGEGLRVVAHKSKVYERYKGSRVCVSGIVQVLGGMLSIILKILAITLAASNLKYGSGSYVAYGIWCGILFVISGGLSVAAGKTKSKCLVISSLVLSIIAASAAAIGVILAFMIGGFSLANGSTCETVYPYYQQGFDECYYRKVDGCLNIAIAIALTVCAIAAITGSAFGCKVTCCGTSDSEVIVLPVYYANNADGTKVLVLGDNQQAIPLPQQG